MFPIVCSSRTKEVRGDVHHGGELTVKRIASGSKSREEGAGGGKDVQTQQTRDRHNAKGINKAATLECNGKGKVEGATEVGATTV